MLKPVSILALDDGSATLASAVQQRVTAACGLDDLVQWRRVDSSLADAIQSIHAQRQRPDSALRTRDDISARELVLMIVSAAGPARTTLLETASRVRQLYEMRRLASFFTIEILCLMPEVAGTSNYAAAYGLLKALSAADPKPYDEVWLLDAVNASRVRFGSLEAAGDTYADAIAGALTFEPEMSGALPGIHPRGMPPAFNSFGYAQLIFPRDVALQRLKLRFAAELVRGVLLRHAGSEGSLPAIRAKQFVVGDDFAVPLSRIGIEAGQSLFKRFQPKARVTENTRSAEEVIAAVRNELKAYRDNTHLQHLETLAWQGEQTGNDAVALLARAIDETLDRDDYASAIHLLEALVDPLPDLRSDAVVMPRNLVTEINNATAALDARLGFPPNTAASDAARRRVRELESLLQDQQLVADTVSAVSAAERLAEMEREKTELLRQLPEILFAEEAENNAARTAARDAEAARLASETQAREQQLRELFAQRPRAEQTLREALEARRTWIWRQILWAGCGVAALYGLPFAFGVLEPNLSRITNIALTGLAIFGVASLFRYFTVVAPLVAAAREALERLRAQIETTDKAKNVAHNDELQFEYDVAHRRTSIQVLRRSRDAAKNMLEALRMLLRELEELTASFAPASIATNGLTISIVDDVDIDAWYERTADDRKPFVREFPIRRSESRQMPLNELRERVTTYAATAFTAFRKLTLATAAATLAPEPQLVQRLKRFVETCAPLIELRDDDLPAQQAMQRDVTVWIDTADAVWLSQIQRRLPNAHVKAAPDAVRVHALRRVLHYPGYVLGQIEYYRAEYDAAQERGFADVPDLLPTELALAGALRDAYEQVLLGRACGVIEIRDDGQLASANAVLGDSHLAAAHRLAAGDAAALRERLYGAIAPRLSIARDVESSLRQLLESLPSLTALDRSVVGTLMRRYSAEL
jgi:hypothetical protein